MCVPCASHNLTNRGGVEIPVAKNGDIEVSPTFSLTPERYQELIEMEAKVEAYEGAGVDNWEGYDHAMETLRHDPRVIS